MIWRLDTLPPDAGRIVGGKARTLARLTQAGLPVPDGFVISPPAFQHGELTAGARAEVSAQVAKLQKAAPHARLAVRSSALGEDSESASFAGAFDTVLDVASEEQLWPAIDKVFASRQGERASSYAQAHAPGKPAAMSVIVQLMVPAELAGVLFTVDPVTGNWQHMTGEFVHGLGEALVAGESNAHGFRLQRPRGIYDGPDDLRPFAAQLFRLAERLEDMLDGPQDIEWAVAEGRLFLLQSRPISTMQAYDPRTGEWNDSKRGDFLWSNANFGEAVPGVMTPLTWSLLQIYGEETFGVRLPGDLTFMGNIAGHFYVNLSIFASVLQRLGYSRERMSRESEELFGNVPAGVEIPVIPFDRWTVLRRFVPFAVKAAVRRQLHLRRLSEYTVDLPGEIADLRRQVAAAATPAELADLWQTALEPELRRAYRMLQAGTSKYENAYRPLHRELVAQVGEAESNLLLSGVSAAGNELSSLGLLLGLWRVRRGELSCEAYMERFGHRSEDEFEISLPRPYEDPEWLTRQLSALGEVDVPAMLAAQEVNKQAAWLRYQQQQPKQAQSVGKKLAAAATAARDREAVRSEVARFVGLVRDFALRAGELSGLGEGIYFLWLPELLALLRQERQADDYVVALAVRRQAHQRAGRRPPLPGLIRGRFDADRWAADPQMSNGAFGVSVTPVRGSAGSGADVIRGLPASAGVVEGSVRLLSDIREGSALRAGEILVTGTTNVGWTPLFPRAAAVVTDVGAPLSHAAIVARELGIPAVVGAAEATSRLSTGARVRVNGAEGTVEILTDLRV